MIKRKEETFEKFHGTNKGIVAILEKQSSIKEELAIYQKEIDSLPKALSPIVVYQENIFIPFLNGLDNLLLGKKKKGCHLEEDLSCLINELELHDSTILRLPTQQLNLEQLFGLQILRSLLLKKKIIILDNILDHLPIRITQHWLQLLTKLTKQHNIHFVLYTTKEAIVKSNYCDGHAIKTAALV